MRAKPPFHGDPPDHRLPDGVIIPPVRDYAPADMSNHLLAPVTSVLTTGITTTETGEQKLTATIRTASTTLTVFLDKLEADAWGRQLTRDAQRL